MPLLLMILMQHKTFSTSVHGRSHTAPDNLLYYLVLIVSSIIVTAVVVWAVKLLFRPGEKSQTHIKHRILEEKF
jgi:hypothetical protein